MRRDDADRAPAMTGPSTDDDVHFVDRSLDFLSDLEVDDSGVGVLAHPDDPGALDPPDIDDAGPAEDPGDQTPTGFAESAAPRGSSPAGIGATTHYGHDHVDDPPQENDSSAVDLAPVDLDSPKPDNDIDADSGPNKGDTDALDSPDACAAQPTGDDLAVSDTKDTAAPAAARYNKKIAAGFVGATAVAALVASGALMAMRTEPHVAETGQAGGPTTHLSVVAAPTTIAGAGEHDSTIPFTATSVGCLPGSTAAQAAASPDPTQAWVCVTGGNAGEFVVLNLGRSMLITAVSLTPGWVGTDSSGVDQWHQHRVATRVQWSFNDSPPTAISQDTGSVHGEATKALPERGVLASRVILLIQETGRAPADAAPTTSPAPGSGGLFGDVLGPAATEPPPAGSPAVLPGLTGEPARTDPADNSFAISSIKIFGHPPQ
ncbi:hypothetical protein AO501_10470 [Mycobacterium gordonae]|uniref:F5/8 type C domain-containing protein n=2 Tax=Mycobacteriaceae TaxID=1762 RepID=A0A0Q2QXF2_MYCGO|nr:hypothetical protein [Mycobacterium simiae]KQH76606.1 hypothetical protein AO501_10470 [Mycobacterium gordonae]